MQKNADNLKNILFILIQVSLFSSDIISYKELADEAKKSYNTVKDNIVKLINLGYPIILEKEKNNTLLRPDLEKFDDKIYKKDDKADFF